MKTKLLIIVMAIILFVNQYDLRVFASTDYNHNELLEYEGYAEAMYESIVEQTTFISGRYTENKEYVQNSIDQIKDYANFWMDEQKELNNACGGTQIFTSSCAGELVETGGAYMLTVGDFIKNLFTDYEKEETKEEGNVESPLGAFFYVDPITRNLVMNDGFYFTFYDHEKDAQGGTQKGLFVNASVQYSTNVRLSLGFKSNYKTITLSQKFTSPEALAYAKDHNDNKKLNPGYILSLLPQFNVSIKIYAESDHQEVTFPDRPRAPITNIKNYINQGNGIPMVAPQPKAYLSCPDGTRINMTINGGTFLDVKGQVMQVSKDGTASIDSQLCNLGWEKPIVRYVIDGDGNERIGISTPDGKTMDLETGEKFIPEGEIDEEIPDDCGMICAIGKFMSGLGTIAKAIAAIPLKILDGLLELVKMIFIPEENFWSTNLDGLKDKFFHDEINEVQNGVESLETVGGGQFGDVNVSLLGVDNIKLIDSSPINMTLDTIHSWVRGFFYPLLLFFNINQMYRVIRGTSLIGIGGKKEE